MENPIISFEEFELIFSSKSTEAEDDEKTTESYSEKEDDEDLNNSEAKENLELSIPKDAIFIGGIDSEVENWTTWIIKDDYYIIPLNDELYDWALFRISWDDNWETWNLSFDARLSGYRNNSKEAAKYILVRLWERWGLDLTEVDNELYTDLLNDI